MRHSVPGVRLSRGWSGLLWFWAAIGSICGVGAVVLQVLGPPEPSNTTRQSLPGPPVVDFASRVPATLPPPELTPTVPEDEPDTDVPTAVAAPQTIELQVQLASLPPEPVASVNDTPATVTPEAPPIQEKTFRVRVTRDNKRCPKAICYKWRLLAKHVEPPRPTTVDLAELDLTPRVRDAVDAGKAELTVDAVKRHVTVDGRDTVVLVATRLTGVRSHGAAR